MEEFPLIFSARPQNYSCFLHLSASLYFFQNPNCHLLIWHCSKSNLICHFLSSCCSSSPLPPGSLHYPVCGPWQDLGSPPADSVPLGCLLFFCSQNRLNYSGGKSAKMVLMGVLDLFYFIYSVKQLCLVLHSTLLQAVHHHSKRNQKYVWFSVYSITGSYSYYYYLLLTHK